MFSSKKTKIAKYLEEKKQSGPLCPFDALLCDWANGTLSEKIREIGILKPNIYIDFHEDYKSIVISGKYRSYFVEIHIEQEEFEIAYDPDEPDEGTFYKLESGEQFYDTVRDTVSKI